jgi:hypothetical protein
MYIIGSPLFERYAHKLSTVSPAKVTFPALVDDEQVAHHWELDRRLWHTIVEHPNMYPGNVYCALQLPPYNK